MDRSATAAVVLVAVVLLAGCGGAPVADRRATASPTGATTTATTATTATTTATTTTSTATTTTTTTTATPEPGGASARARELRNRTLAAVEDVSSYTVRGEETRRVSARLSRTVDVTVEKRVDRTDRRVGARTVQESRGRRAVVDVYVLNGSVYRRSERFVGRYNSEWIVTNVSENFSRAFRAQDALLRHRLVLEASFVRANGTDRVNGTEAVRLELDPDEARLRALVVDLVTGPGRDLTRSSYRIRDADYTVWVAAGSGLPLKVTGRLNSTFRSDGRTVALNQTFTFRYGDYNETSVTLPAAADDAVEVGNGRLSPAAGGRSVARSGAVVPGAVVRSGVVVRPGTAAGASGAARPGDAAPASPGV